MHPTTARAGKASLWRKSGIFVLNLRGTSAEMAAQHGALLAAETRAGPLPYLGARNAHVIDRVPLLHGKPLLSAAARRLFDLAIERPMRAHMPRGYIAEIDSLARAARLPADGCLRGYLQPDAILILLSLASRRQLLSPLAASVTAGGFPGCTSVVAVGSAAESGGVIHARNMDYPAVGKWEPYPAVIYFNPEEGGGRGQRYIGITSAGIHTPGVTGLNEAGITLSTHFHCGKQVSPFGVPVNVIASEIMRRARTLGESIDIARQFKSAGTWSLVLSSAREKRAVVIELGYRKLGVREAQNGRLANTNFFHTPELTAGELSVSDTVTTDFIERYRRALELLDQHHGAVNRQVAARILGDHYDRVTGTVRSQGNTISVVTTVTSMIAESTEGRFWVSNATESPTGLGDYVGFDVAEGFAAYESRELPAFSWNYEGATTIRGTAKQQGFRFFRQAYVAFHTHYDSEEAALYAGKAAEADPDEGRYQLTHGHFLMRMGMTSLALGAFERASRTTLPAHLIRVALLFRGHALDALERRSEAIAQYRAVLESVGKSPEPLDPALSRELRRCLRRPFQIERARKISFDLQYSDVLDYA